MYLLKKSDPTITIIFLLEIVITGINFLNSTFFHNMQNGINKKLKCITYCLPKLYNLLTGFQHTPFNNSFFFAQAFSLP